jgi:hypothetical protein
MHTISVLVGLGENTRVPNTTDLKRRAEKALTAIGTTGITVIGAKCENGSGYASVEIGFIISEDRATCDAAAMAAIRRAFKAAVGLSLEDELLSMDSSGGSR